MKKENPSLEIDRAISKHTHEIYCLNRLNVYRQTDRLFSWFLIAQWLVGIGFAFWVTPKTWAGTTSLTHVHVWVAILLGGLVALFPAFLAHTRAGQTETRYLVGVGQMLTGAIWIHLTGGRIETHFHVFGSLAFLAFYRDWKVLVPATLVVVIDHVVRGVYWPQSVYGVLVIEPWRWLEHAGWVVFENTFLFISCLRSEKEMWNTATRTARDEQHQQIIEATVAERTEALKKSQAQLLQSQKMETVGTLAGGIAHDLNNQLTPVKGYLDMLLLDTPPDSPVYQVLKEAKSSAEACAGIVQRLVNFSRHSSPQKNVLRLPELFDEVTQLLTKFLPATIAIKISCEPGLFPVMGNEAEMKSVFMNLAANARDAMPGGGHLLIKAENMFVSKSSGLQNLEVGWHVLISVSDTGSGIPPEVLPRIFEPFFTTKRKDQGTGLGLAMVFGIIKDHKGSIDVSSRIGAGTSFEVYLPAQTEAQAAGSNGSDVSSVLSRGSDQTVLFADDEVSLRNMGHVFLDRLGYKTLLAVDGEEAVRLYHENAGKISAVVLDMTMPKLTGREALKQILDIDPSAKIIVASGYTNEGSAEDLVRDGAQSYIHKPYTIETLAEALDKVMKNGKGHTKK